MVDRKGRVLVSIPRATAQDLSITSALHSFPPSTSSSYGSSHITLSPKLLLPYHRQSERPLSSILPSPLPSFSPPLLCPSLLLLHSTAYYAGSCTAQRTMLFARIRSGPRNHQRRARSDDASWSTAPVPTQIQYSTVDCRC
jgi:hypothetical protein